MNMGGAARVDYQDEVGTVCWCGISLLDGEEFDAFLNTGVSSRLVDQEGKTEFEEDLAALASTGFAQESLARLLEAEADDPPAWALGEAIAEAFLQSHHDVTWPWNTERDKRTPKASLPGADLVGFVGVDGRMQLALGEVKTSSDTDAPPNVMSGRSGMRHQLEVLAKDLSVIRQLLKWLHPRCKGTQHEPAFAAAVREYLSSGNRALTLFGVLIRDTGPTHEDLEARGIQLGAEVTHPTACNLIAVYLPCSLGDVASRLDGEPP